MSDLADHPFSAENIRRESGFGVDRELGEDAHERAWLRWAAKVEAILGHCLDGDQDTDGYSLDCAYDAFLDGQTPPAHVDEIRLNQREIAVAA